MKLCAFDYLPKPLDLDKLDQQVERALEARRLMRTPVQIDDGRRNEGEVDLLIGRSPAMQEVYKAIGRVALLDAPILVEGESGTGKESVARAVFQSGPRSAAPFRIVHCLDFSDAELEAELFGREEEGATGTTATQVGKVEQCNGGILVLNEIGRLTLSTQSRLLRLLRDREFERVGGRQTIRADVQVIALTSQGLEALVAEKRFRPDLYYLLRSFRIQLPPLRERTDDIPLLVDHFVKQFSRLRGALSAEPVRVSAESLVQLTRYRWPGNLDELQSVLRRALVETKGTIVASDFLSAAIGGAKTEAIGAAAEVTDWRAFAESRMTGGSQRLYADALAEMERSLLLQVLEATHGNQARSARMLGITRGNLRKKLRTLGLMPTAPKEPSTGQASADE
jgi:two-component system nitrogen regulation response regulator GlnG